MKRTEVISFLATSVTALRFFCGKIAMKRKEVICFLANSVPIHLLRDLLVRFCGPPFRKKAFSYAFVDPLLRGLLVRVCGPFTKGPSRTHLWALY